MYFELSEKIYFVKKKILWWIQRNKWVSCFQGHAIIKTPETVI